VAGPEPSAEIAAASGNTTIIPLSTSPTGEAEKQDLFTSDEEKRRLYLWNQSLQQDIDERKRYAGRAYRITLIWVWFLVGITVLHLASKLALNRGLETAEFITIITTTTGSVFGFWWLVGRYLFPRTIRPAIIDPREPLPARQEYAG